MKLQVHVERDEAGYFVAEVPALPGCVSQGKTKDEAIKNVQEAIEGWLEVMGSRTMYRKEELVEVVV
ncbi:MAG: type II toxin-antitoxin system HicB family antitoxin [Nitrospinae bacterium]|nr:type II toxin-antitoxin system HicB family antitoxin [Nitrospinota bacterium]